jgi:uncharacterized protein (TIGR02231 family)
LIHALTFLVMAVPGAAPVTDVVVYTDRARITRRSRVDCPTSGKVRADFPDLPASADLDTLQAEATGARVVAVRWDRPKAPPEVHPLAATLARIRADSASARQHLERTERADERAAGYDVLTARWAERGLWRAGSSPARWAAAVEEVLHERVALAREHQVAAARLRALDREEAALKRQVEALTLARSRPPVTAHVHLACSPGTATVALSYLAAGAGWQPVYEVRAHDGTIEMGTFATVQQSTGEPWNDVRLALSTARPGDRATPPALAPLLVWSEEHEVPRQIVAATEEITAAPTARIHGGAATQPLDFRDHHGLATDLIVPGTARIASGGPAVRLLVARTRHAARVRLQATPRLSPDAFRVAELVNDTPFPLLPGRLEIFRQGNFVGSQPLPDELPVGARLLVSFGVEERVKVSRLILREVERKAGLLGGARHHQFAYRFHLSSYLAAIEELELLDHLPISQLDDVKVVLEPGTSAGHRLEPADGTVSWRVPLRPGEERVLDLAFRVEVPADR